MQKTPEASSSSTISATMPTQRIDKWLWAARFYKTRSQASAAIVAGHARVNGQHIKPAREIRPGDTLDLTIGNAHWTIVVRQLNEQRRPASEAQRLYDETTESLARRASLAETRRLAPNPGSDHGERPTKKARRLIHRFRDGF